MTIHWAYLNCMKRWYPNKNEIQIYGFKRVLHKYTIKAAVRMCMQKRRRIYPTESLQVRNRGTVMNSEKLIYFNISLQMCLKPFPAKNLINKLVKSVSAFCFSCALFVFTEKNPAVMLMSSMTLEYRKVPHKTAFSGAMVTYKYNIKIACRTQENSRPNDILLK